MVTPGRIEGGPVGMRRDIKRVELDLLRIRMYLSDLPSNCKELVIS